jgi:hypothetical protein
MSVLDKQKIQHANLLKIALKDFTAMLQYVLLKFPLEELVQPLLTALTPLLVTIKLALSNIIYFIFSLAITHYLLDQM